MYEKIGGYHGGIAWHLSLQNAEEPCVEVQLDHVALEGGIELQVNGDEMSAATVSLTFRGTKALAMLTELGRFAAKMHQGTN
jgi:hypothetical protein